jgi:hypothetical protein
MKVTLTSKINLSKDKTKIRENEHSILIESSDYDMIITIDKKSGFIDIEERDGPGFNDASILQHGKLTLEW